MKKTAKVSRPPLPLVAPQGRLRVRYDPPEMQMAANYLNKLHVYCMNIIVFNQTGEIPSAPEGIDLNNPLGKILQIYAIDLRKMVMIINENRKQIEPMKSDDIIKKNLPGIANHGIPDEMKMNMIKGLVRLANVDSESKEWIETNYIDFFEKLWFYPTLEIRGITIRMVQKIMLTQQLVKKEKELLHEYDARMYRDILVILSRPDATIYQPRYYNESVTASELEQLNVLFQGAPSTMDTEENRSIVLRRLRTESLMDVATSGRALTVREWLMRDIKEPIKQ